MNMESSMCDDGLATVIDDEVQILSQPSEPDIETIKDDFTVSQDDGADEWEKTQEVSGGSYSNPTDTLQKILKEEAGFLGLPIEQESGLVETDVIAHQASHNSLSELTTFTVMNTANMSPQDPIKTKVIPTHGFENQKNVTNTIHAFTNNNSARQGRGKFRGSTHINKKAGVSCAVCKNQLKDDFFCSVCMQAAIKQSQTDGNKSLMVKALNSMPSVVIHRMTENELKGYGVALENIVKEEPVDLTCESPVCFLPEGTHPQSELGDSQTDTSSLTESQPSLDTSLPATLLSSEETNCSEDTPSPQKSSRLKSGKKRKIQAAVENKEELSIPKITTEPGVILLKEEMSNADKPYTHPPVDIGATTIAKATAGKSAIKVPGLSQVSSDNPNSGTGRKDHKEVLESIKVYVFTCGHACSSCNSNTSKQWLERNGFYTAKPHFHTSQNPKETEKIENSHDLYSTSSAHQKNRINTVKRSVKSTSSSSVTRPNADQNTQRQDFSTSAHISPPFATSCRDLPAVPSSILASGLHSEVNKERKVCSFPTNTSLPQTQSAPMTGMDASHISTNLTVTHNQPSFDRGRDIRPMSDFIPKPHTQPFSGTRKEVTPTSNCTPDFHLQQPSFHGGNEVTPMPALMLDSFPSSSSNRNVPSYVPESPAQCLSNTRNEVTAMPTYLPESQAFSSLDTRHDVTTMPAYLPESYAQSSSNTRNEVTALPTYFPNSHALTSYHPRNQVTPMPAVTGSSTHLVLEENRENNSVNPPLLPNTHSSMSGVLEPLSISNSTPFPHAHPVQENAMLPHESHCSQIPPLVRTERQALSDNPYLTVQPTNHPADLTEKSQCFPVEVSTNNSASYQQLGSDQSDGPLSVKQSYLSSSQTTVDLMKVVEPDQALL